MQRTSSFLRDNNRQSHPTTNLGFISMSDQYLEYTPYQYNLKICPGCLKKTERDIFQLPKGEKHNGGRLI